MTGSPTLEILTPSYAPDFELCHDLVRSIQRFGPPDVRHRILVPHRDLALFRSLADDRVMVESVDAVLPRSLRRVPGRNVWINARSPWPPVRGWIAQQLVKLGAAAASSADLVLLVDSDMVFVRPFTVADYAGSGGAALYRLDDEVDGRLPRHLVWDRVAHSLLGLPAHLRPSAHDYIGWPCLWEPAVVRAMLREVTAQSGAPWATAIGRQLHFSEMVLYGVYVDEVLSRERPVAHIASMRSVAYSDEETLGEAALREFLGRLGDDDLAVMISAKSGTSIELRRRILAETFG